MTIAILKLEAGQKIPRPFSRATDHAELADIITSATVAQGLTHKQRQQLQARVNELPGDYILIEHVDTEQPVLQWKGAKFYAFTEQ